MPPAADRHSPALGDANSVADLQQRLKGWSWQDRPVPVDRRGRPDASRPRAGNPVSRPARRPADRRSQNPGGHVV